MKGIAIIVLMAVLAACASIPTAVDYDRELDFSKYKTYALTNDQLEEEVGPLFRERILAALEEELASKGLSKAEDADMLIDIHIKSEAEAWGVEGYKEGYGTYALNPGPHTTSITYNEITKGSMFITMADFETQIVFWQGVGSKTIDEGISTEKREANIRKIIEQILKNYPPGK